MIEFKGSREDYLHLAEFSYNDSYQACIKMAPFEVLLAENVGRQYVGMKSAKKDSLDQIF